MSANRVHVLGPAIPVILAALFTASASASAATATNLQCSECVGTNDIRKDAIKSDRVKDGQIKPKDLHRKAKPTGVNFSKHYGSVAVPTDAAAVSEVALRSPVAGYALVNASWYVAGRTNTKCSCALANQAGTINSTSSFVMSAGRIPFRASPGLTFVFPVEAGEEIFELKCSDGDTDALLYNISMTALFVPNRYEPEN